MTVKLYGTLRQHQPDYRHADGITVDVPDGSAVSDLLSLLGIPATPDVSVIKDGSVTNGEEPVRDGDCLNIFQSVHGG